jgi:transposase InsO family protein
VFTDKFRKLLNESGIRCKKIRVRTPDMNAYAELFVQTLQQERLDKLILTSEEQLRIFPCRDSVRIWVLAPTGRQQSLYAVW